MRVIIIMLFLLFAATNIYAQGKIDCEETGDNYDLHIKARILETIPNYQIETHEVSSLAEWMAWCTQPPFNNKVFEYIRDSQDIYDWYFGAFHPHGSGETELLWERSKQLCFDLNNQKDPLCAEVIMVSHGDCATLGPIWILSQGARIKFKDIMVRFPESNGYLFYAAFPKGEWDFSNVDKLFIRQRK